MSLLKWLNRKYIIKCPKCKNELNVFYYGAEDSLLLKCVECNDNIYYLKQANSSSITVTEVPHILDKQLEADAYHKFYKGIPSSEALEPKWIKLIRRIVVRKDK
ncbi:hypothetical protein Back11_08260 [Paenibacillus baekrokdamisoli]|uniref:Uncharacterized protein n=1 Tax=Paenibacillus baekrokdamisoli TaxID=1712516 RepID=A0A3G9J0T3_9BACL|nr:hypothetical protein [Paenibacillus baekrokdamisoli]MBB3067331.1 hypothetical protein [Paenibacillus baekrokdamisoli]BBH19481.1 hypothetical protein Back11_08260 [Paenibacillus baekrokdamisoli]